MYILSGHCLFETKIRLFWRLRYRKQNWRLPRIGKRGLVKLNERLSLAAEVAEKYHAGMTDKDFKYYIYHLKYGSKAKLLLGEVYDADLRS